MRERQNQLEDQICFCESNSLLNRANYGCIRENMVFEAAFSLIFNCISVQKTIFVEEPEQFLQSISQRLLALVVDQIITNVFHIVVVFIIHTIKMNIKPRAQAILDDSDVVFKVQIMDKGPLPHDPVLTDHKVEDSF
ncbi:hypothetical protein BDC45DRAFT_536393 [Circinella umbellata]|nr:hypothetical protein BDC45DRAFT_536393 [Circinella umbellata]